MHPTEREHANCPQCNYSCEPTKIKTERKHFDAHSLECDRCLYRTETFPSHKEALRAWNRRRAQRTAQFVDRHCTSYGY